MMGRELDSPWESSRGAGDSGDRNAGQRNSQIEQPSAESDENEAAMEVSAGTNLFGRDEAGVRTKDGDASDGRLKWWQS